MTKDNGQDLSNGAADALRKNMTDDDYNKMTADPKPPQDVMDKMGKDMSDRIQKDKDVSDKTKKELKKAQDGPG